MDALENLLQYGNERIHAVATERGIDWDNLTEQQREKLIDEILTEGKSKPLVESYLGMFANDADMVDEMTADAMRTREAAPLRIQG